MMMKGIHQLLCPGVFHGNIYKVEWCKDRDSLKAKAAGGGGGVGDTNHE